MNKKAIYAREISRKTNSGYLAALYKIYEALILLLLMLKVEMTNGWTIVLFADEYCDMIYYRLSHAFLCWYLYNNLIVYGGSIGDVQIVTVT